MNAANATIKWFDANGEYVISGKIVKFWPHGITVETARGIRYTAPFKQCIEPNFNRPQMGDLF